MLATHTRPRPAAITRYSGTSRFAVWPAASIGTRNGSAPTTSRGKAAGRRVNSDREQHHGQHARDAQPGEPEPVDR